MWVGLGTTVCPQKAKELAFSATELRRKCDRERYASMSAEQKKAKNKKAREARLQKKECGGSAELASTNVTDTKKFSELLGNETADPLIAPRLLPFTDNSHEAHDMYMENNDVPFSCINKEEDLSATDIPYHREN
uniref:Uncharacterized protein n=1 Tax=Leersia perrieri TaxID=77586 RepID=A0A0D9XB36_9ORYZ